MITGFEIRMGIPEMDLIWKNLSSGYDSNTLSKNELLLFKKLAKALKLLSKNPRHPGLQSHEIELLTSKYGFKIFQSYLENNTPSAGRIFWSYGPKKAEITILGIEPHPDDKKGGTYTRINLSGF
jgi:hypothetical protein